MNEKHENYPIKFDRENYRIFRKKVELEIINKLEHRSKNFYYEKNLHQISDLKEKVFAMRNWVSENALDMIEEDPSSEPNIRRILHIPDTISIIPNSWSNTRKFFQFFIPTRLTWPYVQKLMAEVKTYEGRAFLYQTQYKRFLSFCFFGRHSYYCESIDAALRYLAPPNTSESINLGILDADWVKVTNFFGMREWSQVVEYAQRGQRRLPGNLVFLLIQEKVITSIEDLKWVEYKKDFAYGTSDTSPHELHTSRSMIRVLRAHGISRKNMSSIFRHSLGRFKPDLLNANIEILKTNGAHQIDEILLETGDLLWRCESDKWKYLLVDISAKGPLEIARFKRLLQSSESLPTFLPSQLKNLGATIEDLAQCQNLILQCAGRVNEEPIKKAISILTSSPYSLKVSQIPLCTEYLNKPEDLQEYLGLLSRHGYGDNDAILGFQSCFRIATNSDLNSWFEILKGRAKGQTYQICAEWIKASTQNYRLESYLYLIKNIEIPDFESLRRAEPIAKLSTALLEFLVYDMNLTSTNTILSWYYKANGITHLDKWAKTEKAYTILLRDAAGRNNFAFVESNLNCINSLVRERVISRIGWQPSSTESESQELYRSNYKLCEENELSLLLSLLEMILIRTEGILLKSVLRQVWDGEAKLESCISEMAPLINKLTIGEGPATSTLTEIEIETLSLVYRTPPRDIETWWPKLTSHKSTLVDTILNPYYLMKWDKEQIQLDGVLEKTSFLALDKAASYARRFSRYSDEHILDLIKPLRPKRLKNNSSDPWSLADHLGVLLAAARSDQIVGDWVASELETIARSAGAGSEILPDLERLDKFFSSTLPDALDSYSERFIRAYSKQDASALANRLAGISNPEIDSHESLASALILCRQFVLKIYKRWISREKRKFMRKAGSESTTLHATISKSPVSFFAKHAANLCTRDNFEMWKEERHAHLVVFDRNQRKIAGMALVYFQPILRLDPSRTCLIIRAINPMEDMLATHTMSSIVNSFFEVAMTIADQNNMLAVMFPHPSGCHLMSNNSAVESHIQKQYIKTSETLSYPQLCDEIAKTKDLRKNPKAIKGNFFAYQDGQQLVDDLYVFWFGKGYRGSQNSMYSS